MFSQFLANSIVAGSSCLLVALSLGLSCNSAGFFNLTYAGIFTLAVYVTLGLARSGVPLFVALMFSAAAACMIAMLLDSIIFEPLRKRGATSEILLLASLGLLIVLQNTVSLVWGDGTRSISASQVSLGLPVLGARVTQVQLVTIGCAAAVAFGLGAWLHWSRIGKLIRAIASDRRLATTCGFRVGILSALGSGIGAAIGAGAATMRGLDTDLTPTIGFQATLMGLVALVLGGMRSIPTIVAASFALGLVYQLAAWYLPGQWQEGVAMIGLLVALWYRRQSGLLGWANQRGAG